VQENSAQLTTDEIMALALFSHDFDTVLHPETRSLNFNYYLNKNIQEYSLNLSNSWKNIIFYMQSALNKIPNIKGKVYLGLQIKDVSMTNFPEGQPLQWSGYTSASKNISVAIKYAKGGGRNSAKGCVICAEIITGKSIYEYSCENEEDEVILSPNMVYEVQKCVSFDPNLSVNTVYLVQQTPGENFVF